MPQPLQHLPPADPELASGRDPATPFRALGMVALVVFATVAVVGGIAYGIWSATH